MSYTFLQYDKRWATHLYPLKNKKKSNMKTSGCYPTSFADIEFNHNPNITPPMIADYCSSISRATQAAPYLQTSKSITMQLKAGDVVDIRMYNQTGARGVCNVNGAQYLHITRIDEIIGGYDFPVDHGEKAVGVNNAGRCVWTKWNSGKAELDYTYPSTGVTTQVWSSPIYYGDYTSWNNVFNEVCDGIFIESPGFVNCDSNNSQFINVIPMSWDKNGVTGIRFLSIGAKTGVSCRLHIRAVGKWK